MELSEKIKLEKRKRHQIYTTLNYLRPHKSKFDFFSHDALKILKLSKEITKKFKQENKYKKPFNEPKFCCWLRKYLLLRNSI